jgi:hypothetical protein
VRLVISDEKRAYVGERQGTLCKREHIRFTYKEPLRLLGSDGALNFSFLATENEAVSSAAPENLDHIAKLSRPP